MMFLETNASRASANLSRDLDLMFYTLGLDPWTALSRAIDYCGAAAAAFPEHGDTWRRLRDTYQAARLGVAWAQTTPRACPTARDLRTWLMQLSPHERADALARATAWALLANQRECHPAFRDQWAALCDACYLARALHWTAAVEQWHADTADRL